MVIEGNMAKKNSIIVYKNDVALITGDAVQGKFPITFVATPATATKPMVLGTQNVRAKDFILLHEGPAASLDAVIDFAAKNVPADGYLTGAAGVCDGGKQGAQCDSSGDGASAGEGASAASENALYTQIKEAYE